MNTLQHIKRWWRYHIALKTYLRWLYPVYARAEILSNTLIDGSEFYDRVFIRRWRCHSMGKGFDVWTWFVDVFRQFEDFFIKTVRCFEKQYKDDENSKNLVETMLTLNEIWDSETIGSVARIVLNEDYTRKHRPYYDDKTGTKEVYGLALQYGRFMLYNKDDWNCRKLLEALWLNARFFEKVVEWTSGGNPRG